MVDTGHRLVRATPDVIDEWMGVWVDFFLVSQIVVSELAQLAAEQALDARSLRTLLPPVPVFIATRPLSDPSGSATATVQSALGPLGGVATTPVINRPEVAIIGPNRIVERPVFIDNTSDRVRRALLMNLSISCDHRVVDGTRYPAVLFLTGENDPRVDPMQSRKMTARLQASTIDVGSSAISRLGLPMSARDRRSLGLALAQATGLGGGAVGDPQLGKQPVNRIVRRGMTAQPSGQMQILPHGQSRNKAQRLEDQVVVLVVRAQLEAVAARHFQRQFQDVDRVQPQAFAVQLGGRVDLGRYHLEVEGLHQQFGAPFQKIDSLRELHATPWGSEQEFVYCYCLKVA